MERENATGAKDDDALFSMVCDSNGPVEPPEPMPGVGKTGDENRGYPSGRARCPIERFSLEWETSRLGIGRTATTSATTLCCHGEVCSGAHGILWAIPADGHRRDGVPRP